MAQNKGKKFLLLLAAFMMACLMVSTAAASERKYRVIFLPNGGSGSMDAQEMETDAPSLLPECRFNREGYVFINWNTDPAGNGTSYPAGGPAGNLAQAGQEVSLYACWAKPEDSYTVHYSGNGAVAGQADDHILFYGKDGALSAGGFSRGGYRLKEWNTTPDGTGTAYALGTDIKAPLPGAEKGSVTLYAQWVRTDIPTRDITVHMRWDDENDTDGLRPSAWVLELTGSDGSVRTQTGTALTCVFDSLPQQEEDGTPIIYHIRASRPRGYSVILPSGGKVTGNQITITWEHEVDPSSVTVRGTFDDEENADGFRPSTVTLKLTGGGKTYSERVSVSGNGKYEYQFVSLPSYEGGEEASYKLKISEVSGYHTDIDKEGAGSYEVTHTREPEQMDIHVKTVWDDQGDSQKLRPQSFQAVLKSDYSTKSAYLNAENGFSTVFEDMQIYKDGKKISYKLAAAGSSSYEASISGNAQDGFTITQKLVSTKKNPDNGNLEGTGQDSEHPGNVGGTDMPSENQTDDKGQATAYIRTIWDGQEPADVSGILKGDDGSEISWSIPAGKAGRWIAISVKQGVSYTLEADVLNDRKASLQTTGEGARRFTLSFHASDGENEATEAAGTENDQDFTGTSSRDKQKQAGSVIRIGGQAQEETGISPEAPDTEENDGADVYTRDKDGKLVTVKEAAPEDKRLIPTDQKNDDRMLAVAAGFFIILAVSIALVSKKKK